MFHDLHRIVVAMIKALAQDKMKWLVRYHRLVLRFGSFRVAKTYFGAKIKGNINDHIMKRIYYFGVWEPNNSVAIERILRKGDVFVDVGANIGYDTLLGSKCVGLNGRVVAIEPSPAIFGQLKSNVELNSMANVRLVQAAASDEEGEMMLYGGDIGNQGRTSSIQHEGLLELGMVPMRPLNVILSEEERQSTRLIKIDIEGGETKVLRHLLGTLDLYPRDLNLLIEMSPPDGGSELNDIFTRLLAEGYLAHVIENSYDLSWYLDWRGHTEPVRIHQLPNEQCDILFRREIDAAKRECDS